MGAFPHRVRILALLATAFLLRAFIPAGYMPAAAGSGPLFEFCPEGVPAEFMQALSGGDHDAHHDHGEPGQDHHRCPIGQMLGSAAAIDSAPPAPLAASAPAVFAMPAFAPASTIRRAYSSRAPPA